MFLTNSRRASRYNRHGEQTAAGLFLILFSDDGSATNLRACVRHVRMCEFGQYMMGSVHLAGIRYVLSGAYGSDGLPETCHDPNLWTQLTPVPSELRDAWNKGNGWNVAGSEAPLMRQWALQNMTMLRRPIHRLTTKGEVTA